MSNLTLRRKTVLIVSLTVLVLVGIVFAFSQTVLMGGFVFMEERDTETNVNRTLSALQEELGKLAIIANDWATWDDTYRFMQDLNREYIEANLSNSTFAILGLNVMLFVDHSGQVGYAKGFDLKAGQETSLPVSLLEHIEANSPLVYHPSEESSLSGVILLPEGPLLIASEPILTSDGEGPIRGALVFGRYLDADRINRLSEMTKLPITMQRASEAEMPDDFEQALSALAEDKPVFVYPQNHATIAGYRLVTDIYGEPALILRVDLPRSIYHQGQVITMYVMACLAGGAILVGGLCLLLLESSVLSPLSRLSASVQSIGRRKDLDTRIPDLGNDEVSSLASEINRMLDALKQSQEKLKHNEEYFRALMENSLDAVTILGDDGTIRYESPSYERLLGFKPEEKVGSDLFERIHPDDVTRVAELFSEFLQNRGGILHTEVRAQHKDGTWRFIEARGNNLLDNPIVKGIVVNLTDVTERRRMQEELQLLSDAVKMTTESVTIADINRRILEINEAGLRMQGANDKSELLGIDPFEVIAPEDREKALEIMAKVLEVGHIRNVQYHVLRKDGSKILIETSVSVMKGEKGEAKAIVAVARDITERRRLEEALRRSEERLRRYLESSPDGIYVSDLKGNFIYGNNAAERLIGYMKEELIGKSFLDLGVLPPEQVLKAAQLLELNTAGKPTGPDEFELIRKDGSRVWVEISTYPITEGGSTEVIGIARDITKRKHMEQQLQLAGRLAAVGELAAGVAHELNNPLAVIQGYSELLTSRQDLDESVRKDVDTIYREALRASKITKNLLSFARQHDPEKRYISINEVVEKTLELRAHQMKVNNIELVTELQPDLPGTMADFYQMQQVFTNIVINAEQAMADANGGGKLVVRTQRLDNFVQVSFADNGPGISEENLKRIFDPFFTTKDVGKGTGLGLSICYGIVQAHQGRMYARSKLGEGAAFFVEIPIVDNGAK